MSSRHELRVAVVGCGKMGREHARACAAVGARIVAVCDPDAPHALELAANHPGCAAFPSVQTLPWGSIEALFVTTPPFARGPAERLAISEGVPFFVEKPVALDEEHAEPILAALRERPVVHAVGYMNRLRPSVRRARELLRAAPVIGATAWWVGKPYGRPWWLDAGQSGGPFNEQGTHLVDLCRVLAGEVETVTALSRPAPDHPGADDSVAIALGLRNGAFATLLYSCRGTGRQIGMAVLTTAGGVHLEGWDLALTRRGSDGARLGVDEPDPEPAERLFERQAAAFLGAVAARTQAAELCDYAEAMRTQRVVDAIGRAARLGTRERLTAAQ